MVEQTKSKLGKYYPRAEIESQQKGHLAGLRTMYTTVTCADCGAKYAHRVSLKRPAFVCVDCAQKLRVDATNKVKNCMGSYLWHPDEMERMRTLKIFTVTGARS